MDNRASTGLLIATAYFNAWTTGKMDEAMRLIADDIVCDAPAGRIEGAAAYRAFLEPFAGSLRSATLLAAFGDESTALIIYDTETALVPSAPGAELLKIAGGLITHSRFVFDRAPFMAARAAATET